MNHIITEPVRTPAGFPQFLVAASGNVYSAITGQLLVGGSAGKRNQYRKHYVRGTNRREYAHRLVLLAWVGPQPTDKAFADHIDRNRLNNAASNLRWSTRRNNGRHMKTNLKLTHDGAETTLVELVERSPPTYTVKLYTAIHARIPVYGWNVETALTQPIGVRPPRKKKA